MIHEVDTFETNENECTNTSTTSLHTKILGEVATTFDDLERHVILQMDEVYIRSDASYV